MNMNKTSLIKSTKRIINDLTELHRSPLEGIEVFLPDEHEDFYRLHCDIIPQSNVYKGVRIHTTLTIPHDYPLNAPSMHVAKEWKQALPIRFHSHIIGDSICNNILANFISHFDKFETGSGWSPGYTLTTILVQMLDFFSSDDPDHFLPGARCTSISEAEVAKLVTLTRGLKCPSCAKRSKYVPEGAGALAKSDKMAGELICSLTKNSYLTDPKIIFGYPLLIEKDRFGRLWPTVLLELLSYDGYMFGIQGSGFEKLERFTQVKMLSANKNLFNFWIAIYVNEEHYRRARQTILNSISVIVRGDVGGGVKNDFEPVMVLNVLPNLINKTTVNILKNQQSSSTILQAYCHFVRLYLKLLDEFPQLKVGLERKITQFVRQSSKRSKTAIGDLGEFITNFFVMQHASPQLYTYEDIKLVLFKEFLARQIFWVEKKLEKPITKLDRTSDRKFVEQIFHQPQLGQNSSVIAYILLLFNLKSAETFINAPSLARIDQNYGYLPEQDLEQFKVTLRAITGLTDHVAFLTQAGLRDVVPNDAVMANLLLQARDEALAQGYIRF